MYTRISQSQRQQEKQRVIKAQYFKAASDMTKWGQTGTPKRYKRKTDWFGLIAAMIIVLIVVLVLILK